MNIGNARKILGEKYSLFSDEEIEKITFLLKNLICLQKGIVNNSSNKEVVLEKNNHEENSNFT